MRYLVKNKFIAFVFHDTSSSPTRFSKENDLNTPPDIFQKQIDFIRQYFKILHIKDVVKQTKVENPVSLSTALITFDDGYRSLFDFAFPFLEEHKIPATLFVSGEVFAGEPLLSGFIDYLEKYDENFKYFCDQEGLSDTQNVFLRLSIMQWQKFKLQSSRFEFLKTEANRHCGENLKFSDLEKFKKSQYISYGSHLYSHFNGVLLSTEELKDQFEKNKKYCENFPNGERAVSATYGQFDSKMRENLLSFNFDLVFGNNNGYNKKYGKFLSRISLPTQVANERELIFELNKRILKAVLS